MKRIDYKSILQNEKSYFLFYLIILSVYCVFNLFRWPVTAGDTDLWYHLNGGRYIFEHNAIPKDSFFSFMVPPRQWIDYYWLFQVFVYKIHQYTGYYGLVYLRALLFMGLMYFIFRYFTRNLNERKPYFAISAIFSLYLLFLLSRYWMIRPHMFSYFFVVLFIYILEYRQRMAFVLPLLALFWVNIHGIVYPVMLLIVLAYIVEFAIKRVMERKETGKEGLRVVVPLVLVLFMVYCTPHGVRLIGVPVTPTDFASLYILELQKLSFTALSSLNFTKFIPTVNSLLVIIFIIACFSCFQIALIPKRRIAHLILFAGGFFLLIRGKRFAYEFILLAMPVIKDALSSTALRMPVKNEKRVLAVKTIFICFISIIPLLFLQNYFKNLPKFPTSHINLPHGITTFLNKINTGGAVLNQPNMGGYLQWALYPRYKIFMDMEVPFLFTDEDMYVTNRMFSEDRIFNRLLRQYNPPFISVPLKTAASFPSLIIKYPQYKPVFFDDTEVLYVDEKQYPDVAAEYRLKYVDPFTFSQLISSGFRSREDIEMILAELEKMHKIDPDNGVVNRGLSAIYREKRDYQKAIFHADMLIRNYPESHVGHAFKGEAQKDSKRYEEALKSYKSALKIAPDVFDIYRDIGLIYFELKKYRKAYGALIRTENLYSWTTSYKDLYYIIYSAVKANLRKDAEILLRYGLETLPPDDEEWNAKYEELRRMLAVDKAK